MHPVWKHLHLIWVSTHFFIFYQFDTNPYVYLEALKFSHNPLSSSTDVQLLLFLHVKPARYNSEPLWKYIAYVLHIKERILFFLFIYNFLFEKKKHELLWVRIRRENGAILLRNQLIPMELLQ